MECDLMDLTGSEERIRSLIATAISSSDPAGLEDVMAELRAALREHIHQTKAIAVSTWSSISPRSER
jgi:hypothetical protein